MPPETNPVLNQISLAWNIMVLIFLFCLFLVPLQGTIWTGLLRCTWPNQGSKSTCPLCKSGCRPLCLFHFLFGNFVLLKFRTIASVTTTASWPTPGMFCNIVVPGSDRHPLYYFQKCWFFPKNHKKILKETKKYDGIFEKISSVEMKISKNQLINFQISVEVAEVLRHIAWSSVAPATKNNPIKDQTAIMSW